MQYDTQYLREVLSNCYQIIHGEELKKFIKQIGAYVGESRGVNIEVDFATLNDDAVAKTYMSISSNGENGYIIHFDINNIYSGNELDSETAKRLPKLLDVIHTIAHEIEHAVQFEKIKQSENISSSIITIAKESLCEFPKFYSRKLPSEFDAEKHGWNMVLELLRNFSEDNYRSYFLKITKEIDDLNTKEKNATIVMIINGEQETLPVKQAITLKATDIIKKNPNLLLEKPVLRIVYNKDGTKKDLITLALEMKNAISNLTNEIDIANLRQLYDEIISSDIDLITQIRGSHKHMMSDEEILEYQAPKILDMKEQEKNFPKLKN